MHIRWIALILTPLLAACASVPAFRYYTLDMAPRANLDAPIVLDSVRISVNEALARPEILVRTSPTKVEYYALDRWAGGLQEQLDEKLKSEFSSRANNPYVVRISGVLMAFEQVDTPGGVEARVKLDARFEISGGGLPGDDLTFSRLYLKTEPAASATPDAVVEALSHAVEAIALEMANDIQSAAGGASAPGSN